MIDQPLTPFAPPALFAEWNVSAIAVGPAIVWAFGIVAAFWGIYTLIAIYHWLKYSHASWVAVPAIAAHLVISFSLFTFAVSGTLPAFIPFI
ncbi:hypothetical protein HYV30_03730 [Candidatus Kaiserbacteria bacterium]|nr:hypothetical protein [Candidatus Kaiserbacteria bacterium]